MKKFSQKLTLLAGCLLGGGICATGLTMVVEYKPFGVPDSRRDEYDSKIAMLRTKAELMNSDVSRPQAEVVETTFDFGLLDPHSSATHEFQIKNVGDDPLALQVMGTSCKCTTGQLKKDVLQPGESTQVALTWNTGKQDDDYQQSAIVRTNDPLNKEITLTVRGKVKTELFAPTKILFDKSDPFESTKDVFVLYSQVWESFDIVDIQSELPGFEWYAEPDEIEEGSAASEHATSAWTIRVFATLEKVGKYRGKLDVTVQPGDGSDPVVKTIMCEGKVRPPISFHSPEIHMTDGLDIGTLVSGKEHKFFVVARCNAEVDREMAVLDVKPDELQATLDPIKSAKGDYRITLKVPADCPMVLFNKSVEHGYVQVGDPNDESFSNWFPIHGAVIEMAE